MNEAIGGHRYHADLREARGVQVGRGNTQHLHLDGRRPVSWPLQVGVVPPAVDGFQHRQLADLLDAGAAPGETAVLTQVLSGLGGVGKTQLAAEFARRLLAVGEVDLLVWITASARTPIVTGYANTAAELGLGGSGGEDPERDAARFLAWLSTTDRRWLVVLDDLSAAADIRDLWPPQSACGRTVVTTRRRDPTLPAGRNLIEVGVFTEAEAVAYTPGRASNATRCCPRCCGRTRRRCNAIFRQCSATRPTASTGCCSGPSAVSARPGCSVRPSTPPATCATRRLNSSAPITPTR